MNDKVVSHKNYDVNRKECFEVAVLLKKGVRYSHVHVRSLVKQCDVYRYHNDIDPREIVDDLGAHSSRTVPHRSIIKW